MAKASERTKHCRTLKILFTLLHYFCLFGPLLYFIPYAYANGETGHKIAMSMTLIASVVLTFISIVVDVNHRAGLHRTVMWLLILGCLFCLTEIKTFIWIMAITSILDELIFIRLKDYYKVAHISNKEMDKRNG